ncbi:MAG: ABC transporter substrate-binding protein [Methanothrix soehngenii]|nr:ABC transporter substrate-binding protein [Methanothrix soehngenii]
MALAQTDQDQFVLEEASEQTVKIGAIYNLVGSQSPLDLPSASGARLAVHEINKLGGIDGKELELIICDGKSDTAGVGECAKALIAENVSAIIGLSDTDMVLAAGPITSAAGIPFVTSGATSPRLAEENEGLFLACFGDNVQARAGAEYAFNEMGIKTCSLLVDGEMEYARLLAYYFKERYADLGGEIIIEAFINDSDPAILSQEVYDAHSEMVYLAAGPKEAKTVIEALRRAEINSPIFGGDSLDSLDLRQEGMGRIIFSTHALLDENSSRTGEFVRAYKSEYGYPPENAFSALGYDAVKLLAEAIDRAGSSDPEAIVQALGNTSGFSGVTGDISYQDDVCIPNKDVTIISLIDGEIAGSEIVKSTNTPSRSR